MLKNQSEVLVTSMGSPGFHRHLHMPMFENVIAYDKSEQPMQRGEWNTLKLVLSQGSFKINFFLGCVLPSVQFV